MATCYGGMGDTSMENPEPQDVDSDRKIIKKKISSHFNIELAKWSDWDKL